jgi:hypothetical protein
MRHLKFLFLTTVGQNNWYFGLEMLATVGKKNALLSLFPGNFALAPKRLATPHLDQ